MHRRPMLPGSGEKRFDGEANLRHRLRSRQSGVNRLESLGTGRVSLDQGVVIGKREVKGRAFAVFRFNPHTPAVRFNDPFADRQPDACARIFAPAVEAPKHLEDPFSVLGFDPDTIIANAKDPLLIFLLSTDMDLRSRTGELDRIRKQVLKNLS